MSYSSHKILDVRAWETVQSSESERGIFCDARASDLREGREGGRKGG